jgi:hypothetical protein
MEVKQRYFPFHNRSLRELNARQHRSSPGTDIALAVVCHFIFLQQSIRVEGPASDCLARSNDDHPMSHRPL